jgi:hypothetical protein
MFNFKKKRHGVTRPGERLIEFGSTNAFIPYPIPALSDIPKWYKDAPQYLHGDKKLAAPSDTSTGNLGVKYCVPYLDAITTGYNACLWADLHIVQGPYGPNFTWGIDQEMIEGRDVQGFETLPVPTGHHSKQYIWRQPFSVRLPKGYSALFMHPANRFDLPFTTLAGIMDCDHTMPEGNFPFYLKEGFEGIIPAGTPFFQIIPFKRENWVATNNPEVFKVAARRLWDSARVTYGDYKRRLWTRRVYRTDYDNDKA